ncbi:DNA methyltransferase [Neosynechococcus sphagnicola sy1]|uniref:site-specific DNA-methyltransferase (cytosine-N(4)-specific) n=1 Tax=Neosynechococcus sphagnicola sy1 TaxID=1497020 RepID=A0A098TJ02_9CYAN|nr:DNA methyltransferase [Neosynechococcus sphagnicola]KGF71962.1 DNA methyltransferase [Neosynechococcus sphagnicola sy1]
MDTPDPSAACRPSAINQLQAQDRAGHNWYRFVLSFPPHLVRDYLKRFGITSDQQVLDPFCGTGTTLVECKKLGIPSVGVEANAMAHFASQVKLDWTLNPDQLRRQAHEVAERTQTLLASDRGELRRLEPDRQQLLLKNSISPRPLHKTLTLLEQLQQHSDHRPLPHGQLALAKALVSKIGNLHFGPEVGIGTIKADAPVVEAWLTEVGAIAQDLQDFQSQASFPPAIVHQGDARQMRQVLTPGTIDAVITSPPYPNEKDYTRTTRLESVLLGLIRDRAALKALKQGLVRSNTRNVYKLDQDDQWIASHPEIQRLAAAIEAKRIELGKTSGFERLYARVTKLYFGGMAQHLADLRPILRPGAHLAYVVGDQASFFRILIHTGELLAAIAQSLGYELVSIDLFRTRRATATRAELREEVVVLRWVGDGQRPLSEHRSLQN